MTDEERLALQSEILAANGDPEKLAAIAQRQGIDPALWTYLQSAFAQVDELTRAAESKAAQDPRTTLEVMPMTEGSNPHPGRM